LAWQAIPGTVWNISHPIMKFSIQAIATLGFIYILASSFITNHLELFGIRQAWIFANHQQYTPVEFNHHYMYRYSRHPMMAGLLVVFWATPDMSMTRFVLGLLMTLYVFIGIRYEERGLVRDFGETYNQYQKQTGMFYTFR
jgi:methanethiol S-methyltransferase